MIIGNYEMKDKVFINRKKDLNEFKTLLNITEDSKIVLLFYMQIVVLVKVRLQTNYLKILKII